VINTQEQILINMGLEILYAPRAKATRKNYETRDQRKITKAAARALQFIWKQTSAAL
jgi:glucokinase